MMRDVVVRSIVLFLLAVLVLVIARKIYHVAHAHADSSMEKAVDCDPRDDTCAEGCP
jgi:hypothetical protein